MLKILMFFVSINVLILAEAIIPIPLSVEYDTQKAALGKALFFDPGLSRDGSISCASCHHLPGSGSDVVPFSFGVDGEEGSIHSPTVLNAFFNVSQFWDGRAKNLQEQAVGPIINPIEMANDFDSVITYVKSQKQYVSAFKKSYHRQINQKTITDALAEFQKALFTPNSRFDQYLRGDKKALNVQEKQGYELFRGYGCISCHNGVNIGGNMYQQFGALSIYESKKDNLGRYNVTKDETDKYFFKVPTLRNIALTAPYLHDGGAATLRDAILKMMEHQLGVIPQEEEIESIEAFLHTLTGETPAILTTDK